ncbi:Gfo/Idh/MocA family protein [Candidatus Latescibacterota bacterium]
MPTSYRVAVIGTGGISRWHANYFVKLKGAEVVAACDISEERLLKFSEEYGVEARYSDHRAMLETEKPDIVCVCTWNAAHPAVTMDAARAGAKGILCEKPMGADMQGVREMVQVCEDLGTRLAIHHQSRSNAHYNAVRSAVGAGAIGEPRQMTWRTAGGMLNNCSHGIDLTRYLLGDPTWELVMGQVGRDTNRYERGVLIEDFAMGVVRFAGGFELVVEVDIEGDKGDREHDLYGTEGTIHFSASEAALLSPATDGWETLAEEPQPDPAAELVAWIEGGPEHRNAGRIALVAQEIMMALYESARTNARVASPLQVTDSPLLRMLADGQLPEPQEDPYDIRSADALEYALTGSLTQEGGGDDTPKWIAPP